MLLCKLCDLPELGSKGFDLVVPGREIFVVRRGGDVYAYINSCPHTRGPLEWIPDQFLNLDKTFIQCSTHNAQFRIEDGYCVSGPCTGESLTPLVVTVEEDEVWLLAYENGE
jgi:nitrite reductase/ring-hydroxylating ferredoxin subunit